MQCSFFFFVAFSARTYERLCVASWVLSHKPVVFEGKKEEDGRSTEEEEKNLLLPTPYIA